MNQDQAFEEIKSFSRGETCCIKRNLWRHGYSDKTTRQETEYSASAFCGGEIIHQAYCREDQNLPALVEELRAKVEAFYADPLRARALCQARHAMNDCAHCAACDLFAAMGGDPAALRE